MSVHSRWEGRSSADNNSEDVGSSDDKEIRRNGKSAQNVRNGIASSDYTVKRIVDYMYVNPTQDQMDRKELGIVLDDDFFNDDNISFVVEWNDYPDPQDYTIEPLNNIYDAYDGRLALMRFLKDRYFERNQTEDEEVNTRENKDVDWATLRRDYNLKYISRCADISPLAAQYKRSDEKEVRVRVGSISDYFHLKLVRRRPYEKRYPVTWDGDHMFVVIDAKTFKGYFPYQHIFEAPEDCSTSESESNRVHDSTEADSSGSEDSRQPENRTSTESASSEEIEVKQEPDD